jgi:mono/diheme cytochrome c family protein
MLRLLDRGLTAVCVAAALLLLILLFAGPSLIGAKKTSAAPPAAKSGAPADPGAAVFASAGCGNCHALKAAGASGSIGPNLDQLHPDAATVTAIVRSGGGPMPAFAGRLSDAQIAAVAGYVASVAGR